MQHVFVIDGEGPWQHSIQVTLQVCWSIQFKVVVLRMREEASFARGEARVEDAMPI